MKEHQIRGLPVLHDRALHGRAWRGRSLLRLMKNEYVLLFFVLSPLELQAGKECGGIEEQG